MLPRILLCYSKKLRYCPAECISTINVWQQNLLQIVCQFLVVCVQLSIQTVRSNGMSHDVLRGMIPFFSVIVKSNTTLHYIAFLCHANLYKQERTQLSIAWNSTAFHAGIKSTNKHESLCCSPPSSEVCLTHWVSGGLFPHIRIVLSTSAQAVTHRNKTLTSKLLLYM
jgi:hypothetical protein